MSKVRFNYADVKPMTLKKKHLVKEQVEQIFSSERKGLRVLNYIFCSDDYLLEINKAFLKHDFLTDIITFDLSESSETVGEIYISIDRVKENSSTNSTLFHHELLRVIFHGALHLCGYKDKRKSEITLMREKEEYYLRLLQEKYL